MTYLNTLKRIVRQTLPESALMDYRVKKIMVTASRYRAQGVEEVFRRIYKQGIWGGRKGEMSSGEGSDEFYADEYGRRFLDILTGTEIKSLADLGCGDFRVGRRLASGVAHYIGVDVVQDVILRNQRHFANANIRFVCADITKDSLPPADACVVRQVLQHLANSEVSAALRNICKTYPRAFVTEHIYAGPGVKWNIDIPHGPNTRVPFRSGVNVLEYPFSMQARHLFDIDYPSGFGGRFQVFRTWEIDTQGPFLQGSIQG